MSLHWTIVAMFLYMEIILCVLLTIPFVSNKRWSSIFKSNLFKRFLSYSSTVFYVMVVILIILLADAVREVRKYSKPEYSVVNLMDNLNTKDHVMMNMFRSQRNLYISGFALFLLVILRRMIGLINESATLEAKSEAAMKQAESASRAAESMMAASGDGDASGDDKKNKELQAEICDLKTRLQEARAAEKAAVVDVEAMKSQSESIKREYDRLMKEMEELQATSGDGDSKDK